MWYLCQKERGRCSEQGQWHDQKYGGQLLCVGSQEEPTQNKIQTSYHYYKALCDLAAA